MLHSCRNALFYCLLFNSSLNSLEFKFELNVFELFSKMENPFFLPKPFSAQTGPTPLPHSPFPFLSRGPKPHRRPVTISFPQAQPVPAFPSLSPPTGGARLSGSPPTSRARAGLPVESDPATRAPPRPLLAHMPRTGPAP